MRERLEIGAITVHRASRTGNLSPAYARRLYYPLMIFPIPRRHSSSVIAREEMISLEKYAGTHGSLGSVKARGRNKSAKPRLKSMPRGRLARMERKEKEGRRERKREERQLAPAGGKREGRKREVKEGGKGQRG